MKIIMKILLVVVVLIVIILLFISLYKPFGSLYNGKDYDDYSKRASNFLNGKFYNDGDFKVMTTYSDMYKDRSSNKSSTPISNIPVVKYNYVLQTGRDVYVTWLGHSSILLQMHGLNILIDPVFDEVISPVSFIGPKRYSDLAVSIGDLPQIDLVVLTHDHYDHTSYNTLRELRDKTDKFIVPLGIDKDLEKFGISKDKITNMAWWEELEVSGLVISCTPARHFSGRAVIDSNRSLWASWIFKDEDNTIFHSGDSGYGNHFKEIKTKYGSITLAMLDSSQYNESWHDVHMFPEEAVRASLDLESSIAMPIHYGAYVLSNHAWDDPVNRFTKEAKIKNVSYMAPKIGETVNIKDYKNFQDEWWTNIN